MEQPTAKRADDDADLHVSTFEFIRLQVFFLCNNVLCRTLDLVWLLRQPRLIRPYLGMWWARVLRSPYLWPKGFEVIRQLKATGQPLRELMYGETPVVTAVRLFRMAGLGPGGKLMDLGAGRGRALLGARWLGAQALGIELMEKHVSLTAAMMKRAGAELRQGSFLEVPLEGATVIYVNWTALGADTKRRLVERFKQCPPGTRFVVTTRPIEDDVAFFLVRRRLGLFTWGLENVYIHERRA